VLMASLVGAGLAAAGVVYQAILRNPLADPYLLGVSSGASLFAYLWRFAAVGAAAGQVLAGRALGQQAFAFAGAMAAVGVVFLVAQRRGRIEPVTLLLTGVIVNALNGSLFLLINALHPEMIAGMGGEMSFLVGGLQSNLLPAQQYAAAAVVGIGFLALLYLAGQLNVTALSEGEAQALGVRIHRLRWAGLVVGSLMTASVVAISGPIGFVGLICPHLARMVDGTDQRRLLPVATALGAALLTLADAGARLLTRPAGTLLPVGVLTALLGGPFFLLLLWQGRRMTR